MAGLFLLNLGGLPPFPVFFIKMAGLFFFLKTTSFFIVVLFTISSLVALRFYVKLLLVFWSESPHEYSTAFQAWVLTALSLSLGLGLILGVL